MDQNLVKLTFDTGSLSCVEFLQLFCSEVFQKRPSFCSLGKKTDKSSFLPMTLLCDRLLARQAVKGSPTYPEGQEQIAPWFRAWHSAF